MNAANRRWRARHRQEPLSALTTLR
jgi:hypothetical protein